MKGRHTYARVNLDAIRSNVTAMCAELSTGTNLAAVVKANAYGHGAVEVSLAALEAGADVLAVAMADEAVPLRNAGIECPILVIGPSNRDQIRLGVDLGLDLSVFTTEGLRGIEEAAEAAGKTGRAHIKVDTGMSRIGVRTSDELHELLNEADQCRHTEIIGAFTHFSNADEYDALETSRRQYERFMEASDIIRAHGYRPILHASNSAAAQNLPDFDLDMVRFGISMYGYPAGEGCAKREIRLRPAMEIVAEISAVRPVPAGTAIGYGGTFVTKRPSRIATVQIGYGDGYNRLLSNNGSMIVQSGSDAYLAPIVGRVCMDMTMIDVTDCPDISAGDTAIPMGSSKDVRFDAMDIAQRCGTISYEVLCSYTDRVPRIYFDQG